MTSLHTWSVSENALSHVYVKAFCIFNASKEEGRETEDLKHYA